MTHDTPGLVKREIVEADDELVTIVETWDLRVPGCPIIAVRLDPFGVDEAATDYVLWRRIPKALAQS